MRKWSLVSVMLFCATSAYATDARYIGNLPTWTFEPPAHEWACTRAFQHPQTVEAIQAMTCYSSEVCGVQWGTAFDYLVSGVVLYVVAAGQNLEVCPQWRLHPPNGLYVRIYNTGLPCEAGIIRCGEYYFSWGDLGISVGYSDSLLAIYRVEVPMALRPPHIGEYWGLGFQLDADLDQNPACQNYYYVVVGDEGSPSDSSSCQQAYFSSPDYPSWTKIPYCFPTQPLSLAYCIGAPEYHIELVDCRCEPDTTGAYTFSVTADRVGFDWLWLSVAEPVNCLSCGVPQGWYCNAYGGDVVYEGGPVPPYGTAGPFSVSFRLPSLGARLNVQAYFMSDGYHCGPVNAVFSCVGHPEIDLTNCYNDGPATTIYDFTVTAGSDSVNDVELCAYVDGQPVEVVSCSVPSSWTCNFNPGNCVHYETAGTLLPYQTCGPFDIWVRWPQCFQELTVVWTFTHDGQVVAGPDTTYFACGPSKTVPTTWGAIKAMYK